MNKLVRLKHCIEFLFIPFKHKKGFFFNGKYYDYFINTYEVTWRSDRRYEIPIFLKILEDYKGDWNNILEIGSTLNHYVDVEYDVVDKYERFEDVINEDICTFKPNKKYDLIISISTIEHVGLYEYGTGKGETIEKAFSNIISLLNPGGEFIFSYTMNHNKELERYVKENGLKIKTFKGVCFGKIIK